MAIRIFLFTGHPHIGKTSLIRHIVERWKGPLGGYYTEDLWDGARRIGSKLVTLDGQEGVLTQVGLPSRHRLGRFGVNLETVERLAVPALRRALQLGGLIAIDEIGKMELLSPSYIEVLHEVTESRQPVVATLLLGYHPEADRLLEHPEARLWEVTLTNRNELVHQVAAALRAFAAPGAAAPPPSG